MRFRIAGTLYGLPVEAAWADGALPQATDALRDEVEAAILAGRRVVDGVLYEGKATLATYAGAVATLSAIVTDPRITEADAPTRPVQAGAVS